MPVASLQRGVMPNSGNYPQQSQPSMMISGRKIQNKYELPKNENQRDPREVSKRHVPSANSNQDQDAFAPEVVSMTGAMNQRKSTKPQQSSA